MDSVLLVLRLLLAAVFLILLALLIGMGWLLWHILRQQGRLLLRIEAAESGLGQASLPAQAGSAASAGLEGGQPAPLFRLASVQGELFQLTDLLAGGKPVLLLFAEPGCGSCAALFPEVGRWQRDYASKLALVVISHGSLQANYSKVSAHGITQVLLQQEREVAAAYQVTGMPSAVLIGADGSIGSRLAQGADAIRGLVASAIGLPVLPTVPREADQSQRNGHGATAVLRPPTGLKIGEAAPDFSLPDLSGTLVHLSDFRGHQTLVLFWRPSCIFCQHMLPYLLVWETQLPEGAPRLLVISTGGVADNQALGLRSPVVLEQADRSIGSSFGATGTPTAVLVDAEGRIASELAAGAPAIFALVTSQPTQAEGSTELTIGMATYNDFDGASFILRALRLYQDLEHEEPAHRERDGPGYLQETPAKAASDWMNQGVMHRREPMKPALSYLICATERTGSYLLSDALRSTGIAGLPEEFFRPAILAQFPKEASTAVYTAYFQQVLVEGMTPNAVFGAKIHWSHLLDLHYHLRTMPDYRDIPLSELLPGIFPNLRYIHITRQDRLRQAVSFWKAMQTDVWWKTDDKAASTPALHFDVRVLDALMQQIEADEAAWKDYFKHARVQPIEVVYEDLSHSRTQYEQIIRQVLRDLEIPVPLTLVLPEPRYKKQADETSEAWVQHYLQLKRPIPV